ncbi:MAG: SCO family protein [Campylobacterales bacterium]|nr:SCO family protein [Campylobacterales bacterium]
MKSSKYKLFAILFLFLFFLAVPFLQSILFNADTKGAIEVEKTVEAEFIKSNKRFVLVFFGYVGCKDVCTPLLQELNSLYESKEFEAIKKDVEILFVNLTPETEKLQPDLFAKFFNREFKGVYLSKKETLTIERAFGVFFSKDLSDNTGLNHTDSVYLIENSLNKKILKTIYLTHPLKAKKLIDDIIHASNKK